MLYQRFATNSLFIKNLETSILNSIQNNLYESEKVSPLRFAKEKLREAKLLANQALNDNPQSNISNKTSAESAAALLHKAFNDEKSETKNKIYDNYLFGVTDSEGLKSPTANKALDSVINKDYNCVKIYKLNVEKDNNELVHKSFKEHNSDKVKFLETFPINNKDFNFLIIDANLGVKENLNNIFFMEFDLTKELTNSEFIKLLVSINNDKVNQEIHFTLIVNC